MLVSVIVPTYNRLAYLPDAIDSALGQSYPEVEVIVVDDGSTDGTTGMLHATYGERIQCIWQENEGESSARNEALSRSRGSLVAFLDSDDVWATRKLEKQVSFLREHPDTGMVSCHVGVVDDAGELVQAGPLHPEQSTDSVSVEALALRSPVHASTVLVRRAVLNVAGRFDQRLRYGEDWDLCLRVAAHTPIGFVQERLAYLRTHSNTQSRYVISRRQARRRLEDRVSIIQRDFKSLPGERSNLVALQAQALAQEYARAAVLATLHDDQDEARRLAARAIQLDHERWAEGPDFVDLIGRYTVAVGKEYGYSAAANLMGNALAILPPEMAGVTRSKRGAAGDAHMELAFANHERHKPGAALRHGLAALYYNPRWLTNRGVLSLLTRSALSSLAIQRHS